MGLKQIELEVFLAYLKFLGLVEGRTSSSHTYFDYPNGHEKGKLVRPVTVRKAYKDIPPLHLHTNLTTIDPVNGKKNFEKWLKDSKKK